MLFLNNTFLVFAHDRCASESQRNAEGICSSGLTISAFAKAIGNQTIVIIEIMNRMFVFVFHILFFTRRPQESKNLTL